MISKEKDFQEFFPVWNKLTAGQQEQLEHAVRYEHAKKGTIIHNGSLDCVGVLLIHSGQLRAYMISEEGRETTHNIKFLSYNTFIILHKKLLWRTI